MLRTGRLENGIVDFEELKRNLDKVRELIQNKKVLSSYALGYGGLGEAISKMAFGNKIGFKLDEDVDVNKLFNAAYGNIVLEINEEDLSLLDGYSYKVAGKTLEGPSILVKNERISLN